MRAVRLAETIDEQATYNREAEAIKHSAHVTIVSIAVKEVELEYTEVREGPEGGHV